jgi:hypothetical protein
VTSGGEATRGPRHARRGGRSGSECQHRSHKARRPGDADPRGSGGHGVVVAASTGVGPGAARRTGLRPAATLPATTWRRLLLGRRFGRDRASEGQNDGVVGRDRRDRGVRCGDGRGYGRAMAGTPAQSRRGGDASGEGSERGDSVTGAHICLIGSQRVRRNSHDRTGDPGAGSSGRDGLVRAKMSLGALLRLAKERRFWLRL